MKLINDYLRMRVVKKYIHEMAPVLVKSYGALDQFTVPQIEQAARKCGISMQHIPYAIALYRHQESNRTNKLYRIDQAFLDILRSEISSWFFGGYTYKSKDVINLSNPRKWRGGYNTDSHSNRMGMGSRY